MPGFGKCSYPNMAKALIINPYWDTLGGGERYTATFVRWLLDKKWQVDIFSDRNYSPALSNRFGLDISAAGWKNEKYSPAKSLGLGLLFWVSDGSLPISFSNRTIIHIQFPFRHIGGGSLSNLVKSRFYKFVVNSRFTKSFIDAEFRVDSRIVYPPVDTTVFTPGKKSPYILYVGRFSNLTQNKGQSVLISAFRKISPRIPGWKLILAGGTGVGSPPRVISRLKTEVSDLPVEIITDPDLITLKELYSHAEIFWSAAGFGFDDQTDPKKVEHFGISVAEAMTAGAVPVVIGLGGFREIVDDGKNGYLWHTLDELQSITLDLISHPGKILQLSQSARDKSNIFSVANFRKAFSGLLHQ